MVGIGFAGIYTFVALTFLMIFNVPASVSVIWVNMLGSIFIGIYFGLASRIFEIQKWSPLKKTIIHLTLSIITYYSVGLAIGWVPLELLPLILSFITFICVYAIFWFSYTLYYKRLETSMNDYLNHHKDRE
ncbi:DUF3021 domain-containing protein [Salinibacillus aidingensis]|uniref:DUF3021 domain-containing protein n=1 Tax=Salinibacillus aidingensis TaxID=237684 RepID=A0ABP3KGV8_9BACI